MSRLVPNTVLLGKYRVEHLLGQGAMGAVYAAHHIDLGERVAIKCLTEELLGAQGAVERFLREARAAHRLRNKHICQVFDVGRFENGAPFMVMEYLDGEDLMKRVERTGPLPIDLAAICVAQAADALVEAHAAGIIHRDIKPANLLLMKLPDGSPSIKVLDFGIAKLANEASVELTRTSTMIGSAMYMSPEQIRSAKHVDSRSDVWSLGVTLYRLLVAAAPFVAESIPELCVKVVSEEPRPCSSFRPEIPSELDRIVHRCLQKDPALRYQSAAELRDALEPVSRHQAPPRGAFLDDAPTEMFQVAQRDEAPSGPVPAAGARPPPPAAGRFGPPPPPAPLPVAGFAAQTAPSLATPNTEWEPPPEPMTKVAEPGMMFAGGGAPAGGSFPNLSLPQIPNGHPSAMNGFPSMNGFPPMNGVAPVVATPAAAPTTGKRPTKEQLVLIAAAAAVLLLTVAAAARTLLRPAEDGPAVITATTSSATTPAASVTAPEPPPPEEPPPTPTASAEPPPTPRAPPTGKGQKTTTGTAKKPPTAVGGGPKKKTGPTKSGPIPIKR